MRPELKTFLPRYGNNDTQSRQMIPVARGNRYANVIQVTRRNIRAELTTSLIICPQGLRCMQHVFQLASIDSRRI